MSLDTLAKRAEAIATEELLKTISGGTQNSCHIDPGTYIPPKEVCDNI